MCIRIGHCGQLCRQALHGLWCVPHGCDIWFVNSGVFLDIRIELARKARRQTTIPSPTLVADRNHGR